MAALCRTESGTFTLADAHTLAELEEMTEEERLSLPAPTETLFSDCPAITLDGFFLRLADSGQHIFLHKLPGHTAVSLPEGTLVRMYGREKGFFALGCVGMYTDDTGNACPAVKPVKKFVL